MAAPGPPQPPTFPSEVELITVDAVVLDREGRPVAGLTRDDFVLEEDGQEREIVSFEAFATEGPAAVPAPAAAPVAASAGRSSTGAAFALVIDDVAMGRRHANDVLAAVAAFLEWSARDGDEVTLATTSGDAWWTARLPEGREDLLAVAARVRGRRPDQSLSADYITDHEAFWIANREGVAGPTFQRVLERWQKLNLCDTSMGACPGLPAQVRARAASLDGERRIRLRIAVEALRRGMDALAAVRGRKSIVFLSPGFMEAVEVRDAITASREANVAVYFVDVRGLVSQPGLPSVADSGPAVDPRDVGRMAFEETALSSVGAEMLAADTGGFSVRNTNDMAAGADRIAADSRAYYLLGFHPPAGRPPGSWRKLKIEVKRDGLTVRARRGYRPQGTPAAAPAKTKKTGAVHPAMAAALDSGRERQDIPVRAMAFVFGSRPKEKTRVLVAAEFDAAGVTFRPSGSTRVARLEVGMAAAHRDSGQVWRSDEVVEVKLTDDGTGTWRSVAREFELPAGASQARVAIRDPESGAVGSTSSRFDVPPAGALRVSTPVLTDRIDRDGKGGRPRAVLTVQRVFRPGGELYCEFEVFGAARGPGGAAPQVTAGLDVRAADGKVVVRVPSTRITADTDGRVARLVGITLDGLPQGAYMLDIDIRDEVSGARLERLEPFALAANTAP
jgi:VWFA-related protein